MSLADDRACRIQVDDDGEISMVVQQGPREPANNITAVVLPLTARDTRHLMMWLNMAVESAEGTSS
jgi:hypothetical protein